MKSLVIFLTVFLLQMHVKAAPVDVLDIAPQHIFTLNGFDSNDNAQLVLTGIFPNTCYKVSETKVRVDKVNHRIDINDKAFHYNGTICMMMLVNYSKSVNLGVLSPGLYDIYVHDKTQETGKKAGSLNIAKATVMAPDDFLYAPVDDIVVDTSGANPVVTLSGIFAQSCLRMKTVRVTVETDAIVLQPIVEEDGSVCTTNEKKFVESVTIENAPKGRVLFHVRSLNGQSINKILNL